MGQSVTTSNDICRAIDGGLIVKAGTPGMVVLTIEDDDGSLIAAHIRFNEQLDLPLSENDLV